MYVIWDIHLNGNTKNFGGLEWVVDGEYGRETYPGSWAECTVREHYREGRTFDRIVKEHKATLKKLEPGRR